jgi:hypothetical protein
MVMTISRISNIFDPIQRELDQKVFNKITPRPRVVKFILEEMQKVLGPELGFDPLPYMTVYLTGSLTTYQYDKTSDCDVSVFVDWINWPTHEPPNLIRRKLIPIVMDKLDGTILPGTTHPIQHFVVPPGVEPQDLYKPGLRSAWSFNDHDWVVPPEKDRVHDISVELPVLYHRAQDMADKMDNLLKYDPIYAKEFWHQIHRKRQMDQQAGLGDFSEGNIVYKYLLHNGYFDRIRDELGEKISKVAADEFIPPIGSLWVMTNPWAGTSPETRDQPKRKTIEVIDADDDVIWYRNVDHGTEQIIRVPTWNRYMWAGRIYQRQQDWQLQQSPEEAADLWPDTLPENWSRVAGWPWQTQTPGTYFHVAAPSQRDSIAQNGLDYSKSPWKSPGVEGGNPQGNYLWGNKQDALRHAVAPDHGEPTSDIWQVQLPDGHPVHPDTSMGNAQGAADTWFTQEPIPAQAMSLLHAGIAGDQIDGSKGRADRGAPGPIAKTGATQRLFLAYELPEQIVAQVIQWQEQTFPRAFTPSPRRTST